MMIPYDCGCGAIIRLPSSAAGRRARCKQCGDVFTVPLDQEDRLPERNAIPPVRLGARDEAHPVDVAVPRARRETHESVDAIDHVQRSFWQDLAGSFAFFVTEGSFATLLTVTAMSLLFSALLVVTRYFPIGSLIIAGFFGGYLLAFFFEIILQTASGEDELPNVMIDSWIDLAAQLLRMLGSIIYVGLPAGLYALVTSYAGLYDDRVWYLLAAVGAYFWPAVILMVAIGGGFHRLYPHTVAATALVAPLQYTAVCVALAVTGVLAALPEADWIVDHVGANGAILLSVASHTLSVYTLIVMARVIGLYYRHCKHRFAWAAE